MILSLALSLPLSSAEPVLLIPRLAWLRLVSLILLEMAWISGTFFPPKELQKISEVHLLCIPVHPVSAPQPAAGQFYVWSVCNSMPQFHLHLSCGRDLKCPEPVTCTWCSQEVKPQHSSDTKFSDVKGVDEAKHELEEVCGNGNIGPYWS